MLHACMHVRTIYLCSSFYLTFQSLSVFNMISNQEVRKLEAGRKDKREVKRGSWVGVISIINFKFYLNLSFFFLLYCSLYFFFN